jgi:hypothetical protein
MRYERALRKRLKRYQFREMPETLALLKANEPSIKSWARFRFLPRGRMSIDYGERGNVMFGFVPILSLVDLH